MSLPIGFFQYPASTQQIKAQLVENADLTVDIIATETGQFLQHNADFRCGEILPGLPLELFFADGSCFIVQSANFIPQKLKHKTWLAKLESHRLSILLALLLVPATCAWLFFVGIPALAKSLVPHTPDSVAAFIDQQSLLTIDTLLEPSQLSEQQQESLRQQWTAAFAQLGDEVRPPRAILFRDAAELGANAFALPGGTLVMTDQLAELLKDNPDASLAVMLHELGHAQHRHGLQMMASSAGTAMVLALLFNDLEAVNEVILGGASGLLQAKFSREMETEADTFANQALLQLNKSPQAFIDAMTALAKAHDLKPDETSGHWLEYLSSHPEIKARIDAAKSMIAPANEPADQADTTNSPQKPVGNKQPTDEHPSNNQR